jgi:thiamine pyrophosphokinase
MKKKPHHALIIGNGEVPSRKLLVPLLKAKPYIICADGGANKARSYGIVPDCIAGDLDSITRQTRHYFASVPIIHNADQYSTDLEKALDIAVEKKFTSAVIIGAMGERPDHTFSNFSILAKYHKRIALQLFDDRCTVEVIDRRVRFAAAIGQQISLMPMGRCTGITTYGLRYPLRNESLQLGVREGSSNEAVRSTVTVSVHSGFLLLFKIHPDKGISR